MEESFRVRVDKVFGSLSTTSSAVSPALWCLTDEEIERREWNRSKDDDEIGIEKELNRNEVVASRPSLFNNQLESDLQELSEEDEEERENEEKVDVDKSVRRSGDDAADEFSDVHANIGRDCTLDYEEEEDEYDKVAVGKDHSGDRLYMRDVKHADYGIEEFSAQYELPNSFEAASRDPRANHEAANARLKEDAEAAGGFDTLQLSGNSNSTPNTDIRDQSEAELDGDKPKPILKKREDMTDSKSQKRVRFTVDLKSSSKTNEQQHLSIAGDLVSGQTLVFSECSSSVPDYVRNPSRYTHYTFDSTDDMDDQSNRQAYMDLFSYLRKKKPGDVSSSQDDNASVEIPTSIAFTPRKKSEGDSMMKNIDERETRDSNVKNNGPSIVVSEEEAREDEVSAMEEDEQPVLVSKVSTLQKFSGRKYRTRMNSDNDDDDDMHD